MTETKELKAIAKALESYVKKHDGKVGIICDIFAFGDKKFQIVDDRIMAFGLKEPLQISLAGIQKMLKEEKEEFVCW